MLDTRYKKVVILKVLQAYKLKFSNVFLVSNRVKTAREKRDGRRERERERERGTKTKKIKAMALSSSQHWPFSPTQDSLNGSLRTTPVQLHLIRNPSPSQSRSPFPSLSLNASKAPSPQTQVTGPPLVVVGSANADIYVEIDRLPKEGETVSAKHGQTLAGGKGANQAACGGKLSYPTYFVGQVGEDAHGKLISEALKDGGVCLDHLSTVSAAPTGHAVVMLQSDGQNSIIIVGGANMSFWPDTLSDEDLKIVRNAGIVLLQREIPDFVNIQVAKVRPLEKF